MEGKDENKPKIVYFILAVFIHAKRIQMKDEESIHFLLNYTNIKLGSYYTNNNLESLTEIVSIKILHDDNHGGYYIKLNDSHIVDKNTMLIM